MTFHRIVSADDPAGQATLQILGAPPGAEPFAHSPGFAVARLWHTAGDARITPAPPDDAWSQPSLLPAPGGTTALMVTFPPDGAGEPADPQQAAAEFARRLPGLAESFETDGSGFHRTDTIDYGVLLEGELWLDLGHGTERRLAPGDVVVQVGTRHAWRNRSTRPARMFFVLVGATRAAPAP